MLKASTQDINVFISLYTWLWLLVFQKKITETETTTRTLKETKTPYFMRRPARRVAQDSKIKTEKG